MQLTTSGGDELPLTDRQAKRVKKARGKGIVPRFTKGSSLLVGLEVRALTFISKVFYSTLIIVNTAS